MQTKIRKKRGEKRRERTDKRAGGRQPVICRHDTYCRGSMQKDGRRKDLRKEGSDACRQQPEGRQRYEEKGKTEGGFVAEYP